MIGIILAAHGELAAASLELIELLTGEKERVACIGFHPGDSLDTLVARYEEAIAGLGTEDGVLLLTDLKGGSPCNVAALMQKTKEGVRALYGFNIPMLLQVFESREHVSGLDELCEAGLQVGRMAMGAIDFGGKGGV